jgi:hypothetical protein
LTARPGKSGARQDWLWATGAGFTALAVHVGTLAPGMVAVLDTPMFQFVGKVLGVAHNPGYPLYTLLTFPLAHLPIGTLAYRINLFSACCAAVTVALVFVLARRLGCGRSASLVGALGLAFGHVYWSQAIIAEVYTLHTALLAGLLLALVVWRESGRPGFYYAAIGLFAAGLGHHITIVGFLPGVAAYALLVDRRFVLRARTLASTAAILSAGLLQYGFVLIRSRQTGVYLESRAGSLGELAGVMGGAQFSDRLFVFDWQTVLFERLPWIAGRILTPELTPVGMALALAGAVVLLRRRMPEGVLLLSGGCAIVGFAANYSVIDIPVFLIPAGLVLWVLVAVGADRLLRAAPPPPVLVWTLTAVLLGLPAWLLATNYAITDRSRDTGAAVAFDRLFEALPGHVAFVHEDFLVDRMVMFKVLGDESVGDRSVSITARRDQDVARHVEEGRLVLAFPGGARELRRGGWNVGYSPLALADDSLQAVLERLHEGRIVAIAVPARHVGRFVAEGHGVFTAIGGPDRHQVTRSSGLIALGVTGARQGAEVRTGPAPATMTLPPGGMVGETGVALPDGVEIHAGADDAAIRQGSRDLIRSGAGGVMAVWDSDGRLEQAAVLPALAGFEVPLRPGPLSVYPVRGMWPRRDLTSSWNPVDEITRTGSVLVQLQPGTTVALRVSDDAPLLPRVVEQSPAGIRVQVEELDSSSASAGRVDLTHVHEVVATATGSERVSALIALGGVPEGAEARVVTPDDAAEAAAIFRVETAGLLRTPDASTELLVMSRDDQAQLTGHGWSAVDFDTVSPYRWMTGTEARLVLPVTTSGPRAIQLQARLREGGRARTVAVRLNGIALLPAALAVGWRSYEWDLPPGLAAGTHELTVVVDEPPAPRDDGLPPHDVAVTDLRVLHGPS